MRRLAALQCASSGTCRLEHEPTTPAIVIFSRHAERRLAERGLTPGDVARLLLENHERRRRNPGDADWMLHVGDVAIAYVWLDGDDATTAVVVTAWRQ